MIKKDMTVSDVIRENPASTQVLMSYGICDCCGGHLTLEESAEAKGIDVKSLLEKINNV